MAKMRERSLLEKRLERVRLGAIMDAFSAGVDDHDELMAQADAAEQTIPRIRGYLSEQRFDEYARKIDIVRKVKKASPRGDERGVDRWVTFKKEAKLPMLPVQIKSSERFVKSFRKSEHYQNLGGQIIVVRCGPKMSEDSFAGEFLAEVERVRLLLEESS